jgi:hypothetical protein
MAARESMSLTGTVFHRSARHTAKDRGRVAAWAQEISTIVQCAIAVTQQEPQGAAENCFQEPISPP